MYARALDSAIASCSRAVASRANARARWNASRFDVDEAVARSGTGSPQSVTDMTFATPYSMRVSEPSRERLAANGHLERVVITVKHAAKTCIGAFRPGEGTGPNCELCALAGHWSESVLPQRCPAPRGGAPLWWITPAVPAALGPRTGRVRGAGGSACTGFPLGGRVSAAAGLRGPCVAWGLDRRPLAALAFAVLFRS